MEWLSNVLMELNDEFTQGFSPIRPIILKSWCNFSQRNLPLNLSILEFFWLVYAIMGFFHALGA